ncbi:MAG: hypothetical protein P1U74_03700 [Legionellaceae bacterium]|nr:hypothetical protein [Legionellaceae bacterium]
MNYQTELVRRPAPYTASVMNDLEKNNTAGARAKINAVVDKTTSNWKYLNAKCLMQERYFEAAIEQLESIANWRQNIYVLFALIQCFSTIGNYKETQKLISLVMISFDVNDHIKEKLIYDMAKFYYHKGLLSEAVSLIKSVPSFLRNDETKIILAETLQKMANYDETICHLLSAECLVTNELTLLDQGNLEAIRSYQSIQQYMDNPKVVFGIARIYINIGTKIIPATEGHLQTKTTLLSMALKMLERISATTTSAIYLATLGDCYLGLEMVNEALTVYSEFPNLPDMMQDIEVKTFFENAQSTIAMIAQTQPPQVAEPQISYGSNQVPQETNYYTSSPQRMFIPNQEQTGMQQIHIDMINEAKFLETNGKFILAHDIYLNLHNATADPYYLESMQRCAEQFPAQYYGYY